MFEGWGGVVGTLSRNLGRNLDNNVDHTLGHNSKPNLDRNLDNNLGRNLGSNWNRNLGTQCLQVILFNEIGHRNFIILRNTYLQIFSDTIVNCLSDHSSLKNSLLPM